MPMNINISMDIETYHLIDEFCREKKLSRSEFLTDAGKEKIISQGFESAFQRFKNQIEVNSND